jgi:hypothetical protein
VIAQCINDDNTNSVTCDQLIDLVQAITQVERCALLPVLLPKDDLSESYRVKTCDS